MNKINTASTRAYLATGSAVVAALCAIALLVDPAPDAIAGSGVAATNTALLNTLNTNWPLIAVVFAAVLGIGIVMRLARRATH
jgi:hypothetical protein